MLEMKIEIESRICFVCECCVCFVGDAGRLCLDVLLGIPRAVAAAADYVVVVANVAPRDPNS